MRIPLISANPKKQKNFEHRLNTSYAYVTSYKGAIIDEQIFETLDDLTRTEIVGLTVVLNNNKWTLLDNLTFQQCAEARILLSQFTLRN